ncbi:hypothetical protein AM228_15925 [Planktothricoides sp. SR001]|nr:hypothetical protein AM228_15925 [Planktothricoides sp. SR001]
MLFVGGWLLVVVGWWLIVGCCWLFFVGFTPPTKNNQQATGNREQGTVVQGCRGAANRAGVQGRE